MERVDILLRALLATANQQAERKWNDAAFDFIKFIQDTVPAVLAEVREREGGWVWAHEIAGVLPIVEGWEHRCEVMGDFVHVYIRPPKDEVEE